MRVDAFGDECAQGAAFAGGSPLFDARALAVGTLIQAVEAARRRRQESERERVALPV